MYCNLCKRPVEAKRNLGIGTLLLVVLTAGIWLIAIPFYSKRCAICKSDALSNSEPSSGSASSQSTEKKKTNWIFVIGALVVIGMMGNLLTPKEPKNTSPSHATAPASSLATQTSPDAQVTKKDGTVDSRPNDLEELCKDYAYYKAKAYKYGREGDEQAAAEARKSFEKVNIWLSQYAEGDVSKTCSKYDTSENLSRYMR